MNGVFKGKTYLLVLIVCLLVSLLIILITCICYHQYAANRKKQKYILPEASGSIIKYDTLRFVYNTTVESQQTNFPLEASQENVECNIPRAGSLSSQSELECVDLVQPQLESQRVGSLSVSDTSSDIAEETVNEDSNLAQFSHLRSIGLGRLSVSLFFNKSIETLRVNIIQWDNIGSASLKHGVSPYVKVNMLPDMKATFCTKTKGKENPIFDEEFSFAVEEKELKPKLLCFSVCDFDKFSRQCIVGTAVLHLEKYFEALVLPEGTGELWLNLLEPNEMSCDDQGDVLYSLQYSPTIGRITFTLVKAKDLNVADDDSSIAVKVSLLFGRKIVTTHKVSYHQTDMRNPTFNESWVFDIPSDVFEQTNFRLSVYAYSDKKKRMIGKTTAGTQTKSTDTALVQWNEMISKPRTPILQWHKLV